MWLLSTNRAELHFLTYTERIKDGHAILSQVWNRRTKNSTRCSGIAPSRCRVPYDSKALRTRGAAWIPLGLADTCYIDKTSSVELSEAVNSIFATARSRKSVVPI